MRARAAFQVVWGAWVLSAEVLALVEAYNGKKP
jgi:hypothetical protein